MSLNRTDIQWTWTLQPDGTWSKGSTWNPSTGCRRVSPGCGKAGTGSCYAERLISTRLRHLPKYEGIARFTANGPQFTGEHRIDMNVMLAPLRSKRGRRIFVNDMGDLFFEGHPFEDIAMIFAVMLCAHWHTFQVLTKRAKRMREFLAWITEKPERLVDCCERAGITEVQRGFGPLSMTASPRAALAMGIAWPLPNLWIGCTTEDRKRFDERVPELLECPAVVRFLSVEPQCEDLGTVDLSGIDWCINGGWSGPGAGPFDIGWMRSLLGQARAQGVSFFGKQWGARPVLDGKPIHLQDGHGGDMAEWAAIAPDLMVREFPTPRQPEHVAVKPAAPE